MVRSIASSSHSPRRRWARGVLLALAGTGLCLAATPRPAVRADDPPATAAPADAGKGEFKAFTQVIPGTAVSIEMIPVKGGTVEMELPGPDGKPAKQTVTLKDVYFAKIETPWDAYDYWRFMKDLKPETAKIGPEANLRPSTLVAEDPYHDWGREGFPALHVSYKAATEFCNWLSAKSGKHYRLPTEAEWQYAATAGGKEPTPPTPLTDYAWVKDNAEEKTHPCGSKKPNALGLCDMLGNVAEWVVPADGEKVAKVQRIPGKTTFMTGVVKGGSFNDEADGVSAATRAPYDESWQEKDPQLPKSHWWLSNGEAIGFRIVCDP